MTFGGANGSRELGAKGGGRRGLRGQVSKACDVDIKIRKWGNTIKVSYTSYNGVLRKTSIKKVKYSG